MVRFLVDENFNGDLLRSLVSHLPSLDAARVQDRFASAKDPAVLELAAREERIILTHDVNTLPGFAFDRVKRGQRMPGVFEVLSGAPFAQVLEDLLLLAQCSLEGEWEGQVIYIPFDRTP